jgi:hypothetical protein
MVQSLCNACGIRQRKARRAMAAAASNGGAAVTASVSQQTTKQAKKEKGAEVVDRSLPFKKRCKMVAVDDQSATAPKAVAAPSTGDQGHVVATGDDSTVTALSLRSESSTPPADEITDAAMMLMTLSCGLVRSG